MAMMPRIARGLLLLGAVALTVGLANVLVPAQVFPSRMTCVTDYDQLWCYTHPWPPAPWLALLGGAAIATAAAVLSPREGPAAIPEDDTT